MGSHPPCRERYGSSGSILLSELMKATGKGTMPPFADKLSDADSLQVKSISLNRFIRRLGKVSADQLEEIRLGVGLCLGLRLG